MKEFHQCRRVAEECGIELNGAISFPFKSIWEGEIHFENVVQVVEAYLDAGIEELSLSDTHSLSNPVLTYERTSRLMERFPQVKWWAHLHDSRGIGIANAWACYKAGIRKFDISFAGVGGCPYLPDQQGILLRRTWCTSSKNAGFLRGLIIHRRSALLSRWKNCHSIQ
ncbi:MAG: hypothetical protein IJ773_08440 [Lachnospiraceae bacterium]|nr:hypothetical protein [Lachnospiraceae bacterium]